MPLSNKTLEIIICVLFLIIFFASAIKSWRYKTGEIPSKDQPPGDELDENDWINQENPFYYE